jgi:hypothetical protein
MDELSGKLLGELLAHGGVMAVVLWMLKWRLDKVEAHLYRQDNHMTAVNLKQDRLGNRIVRLETRLENLMGFTPGGGRRTPRDDDNGSSE